MDITPTISDEINLIGSYGDNEVTIKLIKHPIPLYVAKNQVVSVKLINLAELDLEFFVHNQQYFNNIECLLLGCGNTCQMPSDALKALIADLTYTVEIMTIGAACRTYNVLAGEDRKIGLLLLKA
ncbi:MAG: Mth938-like domain-containing protein [Pseudomonadota bacterium]